MYQLHSIPLFPIISTRTFFLVLSSQQKKKKNHAASLSQAMALNLVFLFFLLLSPPILSDGVLQVMGGSMARRRSLLQAKKDCPVNFEYQNYTIITSKCKSPWPANLCCPALNDFACNFSQYLNDESNNCAEMMITYLSANGNYPAGLFSNECQQGIVCNGTSISTNQTANGSSARGDKGISDMCSLVMMMSLTVSGLGLLLFY